MVKKNGFFFCFLDLLFVSLTRKRGFRKRKRMYFFWFPRRLCIILCLWGAYQRGGEARSREDEGCKISRISSPKSDWGSYRDVTKVKTYGQRDL